MNTSSPTQKERKSNKTFKKSATYKTLHSKSPPYMKTFGHTDFSTHLSGYSAITRSPKTRPHSLVLKHTDVSPSIGHLSNYRLPSPISPSLISLNPKPHPLTTDRIFTPTYIQSPHPLNNYTHTTEQIPHFSPVPYFPKPFFPKTGKISYLSIPSSQPTISSLPFICL